MAVTEVRPGQVWRWMEPTGKYREMLVERIQDGPGTRRAMGCHPRSGRRMQVQAAILAKGLCGAELIHVVENYVWLPTRPR